MGYYGGWSHEPVDLAQQQHKILYTFPNKEEFIIVGTRPMDGSVDAATLDAALKAKWGKNYISAAEVTTSPSSTYEADTFPNKEKFIIVGTRPMDGSVDAATLDAALKAKWGKNYISAAEVTTSPSSTYEAQAEIAQAVLDKLEELKYIQKEG